MAFTPRLCWTQPILTKKSCTLREGCGTTYSSRASVVVLEDNEDNEADFYSGRKADERPARFWLEGKDYRVEAVLDQWYDPEHIFYKARADDGNLYIFTRNINAGRGVGPDFVPTAKSETLTSPGRPYSTATFVPFWG
jgi:hypothetical protein